MGIELRGFRLLGELGEILAELVPEFKADFDASPSDMY